MKRIAVLLLTITMTMGLCACGKGPSAPTWQEQYDLGVKYLSEGNYEEAILAFTAAIEIDPKQPAAYAKLAEIYLGQGEEALAREVLRAGIVVTGDSNLIQLQDNLLPPSEVLYEYSVESDIYPISYNHDRVSWWYEEGGELAQENEGAIGSFNAEYFSPDEDESVWDVSMELIYEIPEGGIDALIDAAVEEYAESRDFDAPIYQHFAGGHGVGIPMFPEEVGSSLYFLVVEFAKKEVGQDVQVVGYMLFEDIEIA